MSVAPTVSILGGSIWGNRGAEAMITTCVGYIRAQRPQTTFAIFSYLPYQDRTRVMDRAVSVEDARPVSLLLVMLPFSLVCWLAGCAGIRVPDVLLPRSIQQLRKSAVALDVFGISFSDGREVFLPFNVLALLPAMLLGVPVVKLSQAMGPFRNRANRFLARMILSRCQRVFARGRTTLAHLQSLELRAELIAVASDLAFLYQTSYSLTSENRARVEDLIRTLRKARQERIEVVAICPSSVVFKKATARQIDYVGVLVTLVDHLLSAGRTVLILPHATREGSETLRNNDLPIVKALRSRCSQHCPTDSLNRILCVDFDVNSASIRELTSLCTTMITSRFHAMIAALSLQIPPLVLGWSHKYAEVLQDFDIHDACFDIDAHDPADFLHRIESVTTVDTQPARKQSDHLASVRASSAAQLDYVVSLLT